MVLLAAGACREGYDFVMNGLCRGGDAVLGIRNLNSRRALFHPSDDTLHSLSVWYLVFRIPYRTVSHRFR
jgi:hypothetical protein